MNLGQNQAEIHRKRTEFPSEWVVLVCVRIRYGTNGVLWYPKGVLQESCGVLQESYGVLSVSYGVHKESLRYESLRMDTNGNESLRLATNGNGWHRHGSIGKPEQENFRKSVRSSCIFLYFIV